MQLLHKLSIRSTGESSVKLLKVVKNDLALHLPTDCTRILLSGDAPVVKLREFVELKCAKKKPLVFFVGAFASGIDDFADEIDEKISVSEYSLSASVVCAKICCAFEDVLEIV